MAEKMADSILDVLKENGVEKEKIGVDIADPSAAAAFERAGINTVSAWPVMSGARVVKTPDELECLKISSAFGDTSFWKIEHEWLKPGVKESYITAKVNEYLYEQRLRLRLRHHRRLGRQHQPVPPLAHRQGRSARATS